MAIPYFDDKYRLLDIRKNSLNPTIQAVNELDPKVKGLQAVVALAMTDPVVNIDEKKITFELGSTGVTKELDLGPMFDSYQHGIGVSGSTGGTIPDIEKIMFKNLSVRNTGNKSVEVTAPELQGQVDTGMSKTVKYLRITGNTAGSSLATDGTMTLNMANNSIDAGINGQSSQNISAINVQGDMAGSTVSGGILNLKMPPVVKGSIVGGDPVTLKSVKFTGNTKGSVEGSGDMVINLPTFTGEIEGDPPEENITGVKVIGNKGNTKIENEILIIDLPAGGGGGTVNPLKVGVSGKLIPNVEEIHFKDSEVKVDITTRSSNKVLIEHKGTPVSLDDGTGVPSAPKYVKQVTISGDVEGSQISEDTGVLNLLIPKHAGLTVSDDTTTTAGVTSLKFANAKISTDSSSTPVTTVSMEKVSGQIEDGTVGSIDKIKVKGNIGGTTFSNGLLTIDLPAGGGGTGPGSDITGVVGSQSAKINRIEVIGANTYNSSVTGSTLKIDTPRKVAIRGGINQYSDVDVVEVANSTVQLDVAGGQRKALITPHIPYMFFGWFTDIDTLNRTIPEAGRIPTKTCAYVPHPVTKQNTLMMWMPNVGTGISTWIEMPVTGSLALADKGHSVQSILAVNKNPMVSVDSNGLLSIADTTVPEVLCETLNQEGTATVEKGKFNVIRFEDGDGVTRFDPSAFDLKIHRAQRRLSLGSDPDTESPSYIESKYEGSIWLNKSDNSWWGYNSKDVGPGQKKWTKIIHRDMSQHVTDIRSRVPKTIPTITVGAMSVDNTAWNFSGWTYLDKTSPAIPEPHRNKCGGYVQTFMHMEGDLGYRSQYLYLDQDPVVYKRHWDAGGTWSTWLKTSFSDADLKVHNENPSAHSKTNPFYKVVCFGSYYKDIKTNNYEIPLSDLKLMGSSNGLHTLNGNMFEIPYSGKYRLRGHLYFHHEGLKLDATPGTWHLIFMKKEKGSTEWKDLVEQTYEHFTTSLLYPPLKWDISNKQLNKGDTVKMCLKFTPTDGNEAGFLIKYSKLGLISGRSFSAIDVEGNDGGYALGDMYRSVFGPVASLNPGGSLTFKDNTTIRVVPIEIDNNVRPFG